MDKQSEVPDRDPEESRAGSNDRPGGGCSAHPFPEPQLIAGTSTGETSAPQFPAAAIPQDCSDAAAPLTGCLTPLEWLWQTPPQTGGRDVSDA